MENKNNSLYFIYNARAKNTNERVEILVPEIIPDTVQYSYTPNFQSQSLLGRRSPIFMYTGGSKKSYDFSLKLHEDILEQVLITENGQTFTPTSLVQLVDYFKMLAYPMTGIDGTTSYPQMYFQIGDLAGYGIITVTPQWEKPYRSLRYVQATVSFSLTIENEVSMPTEPETRSQEVAFADLVYDYKISLNLTQQEAERLVEKLGPAYQGSVEDFIKESDVSQFATSIKEEIAIENYNYQVERMKNIYTLFKTATGQEIIEELSMFNEISRFTYEALYTEDETDAKIIADIKDQFRDYLNYFYDDVSTDMTRDEYFQVLDSVFTTLENLQKFAEEIYGYGQSS